MRFPPRLAGRGRGGAVVAEGLPTNLHSAREHERTVIPLHRPYAGIRGGHAHVEGTRIGVHDVIGLLQNGEPVDSLITNCFPDLTRAQFRECLAYYEDHWGEIDVLVARQMSPGEP